VLFFFGIQLKHDMFCHGRSTIFLNIHWWLDKVDKTGSPAQFINGFFLMASFAITRLGYGGYTVSSFSLSLLINLTYTNRATNFSKRSTQSVTRFLGITWRCTEGETSCLIR
jgi:hypothetical protein